MKRVIVYLLILIAAVWLGIFLVNNPMYVLLVLKNYTVQMPVWFVAVALLLVYFILAMFGAFIRSANRVGREVNRWGNKRDKQRAIKQTNRGLIQLAEGHWRQAERHLLKGAAHNVAPLVNYLALAEVAQASGEYDKRDQYLHKAHDVEPDATVAIGITQAKLQLHYQQYEQSLATLEHIRTLVPKHVLVLKLLKKIYCHLNDWQQLADLLPNLQRHKAYDTQTLLQLTECAYSKLLTQAETLAEVQKIWSAVNAKDNLILVKTYSQRLLALGNPQQVEKLLRHYLKRHWQASLLPLYAQADADAKKQLSQLEHWASKREPDAELFAALAVLSERNQLWGQAQDYYEQSVQRHASSTVYAALARLCENQGSMDKAHEYYKQGLLLVR